MGADIVNGMDLSWQPTKYAEDAVQQEVLCELLCSKEHCTQDRCVKDAGYEAIIQANHGLEYCSS